MARKTLEAVFGALGAGLTGYGREQATRIKREEQQKRTQLADALTAANMLASGRFGTEAQLKQSGGQAFRTAGQLASGALPMGGGAPSVIPSVDDLSNLGTAQRRGPAPPMFDVGGQRLGVMRTAADEARETANRELQAGALEREQRLADAATQFAREQAGRMALAREQGRQVRLTQSERPTSTTTTGTGRMGLPALPTIVRDADELKKLNRNDISRLNSLNVYSAAQAPLLAAEAKDPFTAMLAGGGNVLADKEERKYAQYVGSISDAVARLSEAGVLTNQDIARFRAQTLFMPGDDIDTKMRKHGNLTSWAGWVVDARRLMSGDMTPEAMQSLRSSASQIGQEAESRDSGRASTATQSGTTTGGGYTAADYQAALAVLGADAEADDVRAWLRTNRRR